MYHDVKVSEVSVTVSIALLLKIMGCWFGKAFKVSLSWNYCMSHEVKFISQAIFQE